MDLSPITHKLSIPDGAPCQAALRRTTHLGIGAHQDDLEFMALHGILACFQRDDRWFGGITCTDGAGSSRSGRYAHFTDQQMKTVRSREQISAAMIGQYSFIAQLGYPSADTKTPHSRQQLTNEIHLLLQAAQPEIVYTHNPFDKHPTHLGVLIATLAAIHQLPPAMRPQHLFGCEVWRSLDWLPDELKTIHDVSAHPNLAAALNGVFDSQISGGKRYDLAVDGRRRANATFLQSHSCDNATHVAFALDLSGLMANPAALPTFMQDILNRFNCDILDPLRRIL